VTSLKENAMSIAMVEIGGAVSKAVMEKVLLFSHGKDLCINLPEVGQKEQMVGEDEDEDDDEYYDDDEDGRPSGLHCDTLTSLDKLKVAMAVRGEKRLIFNGQPSSIRELATFLENKQVSFQMSECLGSFHTDEENLSDCGSGIRLELVTLFIPGNACIKFAEVSNHLVSYDGEIVPFNERTMDKVQEMASKIPFKIGEVLVPRSELSTVSSILSSIPTNRADGSHNASRVDPFTIV
jgi:hypothetical protein